MLRSSRDSEIPMSGVASSFEFTSFVDDWNVPYVFSLFVEGSITHAQGISPRFDRLRLEEVDTRTPNQPETISQGLSVHAQPRDELPSAEEDMPAKYLEAESADNSAVKAGKEHVEEGPERMDIPDPLFLPATESSSSSPSPSEAGSQDDSSHMEIVISSDDEMSNQEQEVAMAVGGITSTGGMSSPLQSEEHGKAPQLWSAAKSPGGPLLQNALTPMDIQGVPATSLGDAKLGLEHPVRWQSESILALDYLRHGSAHNAEEPYMSIRSMMDATSTMSSTYTTASFAAMQDDVQEESQFQRGGLEALRSGRARILQARDIFSQVISAIDRGLY
ncbi:hypothetical protein HWV62_17868 [Athelia sp. TMB]|nr:hypothetical protein HWV62_17868 [Athelia sp. TMB]